MPGTLFVVATPIGNLEDISARALRVLGEVAIVAAEDTRRTAQLLHRYAIRTPTTSLNAHNEGDKTAWLVGRLLAGDSVAVVSDAGTPTVSDPGVYLVQQAVEAGVRIEALPGASAVTTLLSVAALAADEFCFLGFPPVKPAARDAWFQRLSQLRMTTIFFEAPHRLVATLEQLRTNYGDCQIVVGRELTKLHEEVLRGPVSEVLRAIAAPVGEFVVAVNLANQQITAPAPSMTPAQVAQLVEDRRRTMRRSKRQAIADVARSIGLKPNIVYEMVEMAKGSGE